MAKANKKMKAEELMYLGLGMAALAKDKLVDATDYLAKETGLAKNSSALQKKLVAQGKREYAALMRGMEKGVKSVSKRAVSAVSKKADKAVKVTKSVAKKAKKATK